MEQATTIGLDIAKHVFQVHGADAAGHVLFRKRVGYRVKPLDFFAAQASPRDNSEGNIMSLLNFLISCLAHVHTL